MANNLENLDPALEEWSDHVTITVTVPANLWLSSNDRRYWAEKAQRTKLLRRLGFFEARSQARGHHIERANVSIAVSYPRAGRADPPNVYPTVKALMDGFTDAKLWYDDDSEHVIKTSFVRHPHTSGQKGVHVLYFDVTGAIQS